MNSLGFIARSVAVERCKGTQPLRDLVDRADEASAREYT